jgi:hypothetical protein
VGNGEARNCADPSHNHTIHGGSFWAEAFYTIMARVRAGVPAKSAMYMTEGAKEEVSGAGFDILLGLQWQGLPFWSAIYGGYGYSTGRAGSVNQPLAGGLCIELTKQFMVGGTMGWFTYERYCHDGGDASTACSFLDPRNAAYVGYIRRLSAARVAAKRWMVHGRASRSLALGAGAGEREGAGAGAGEGEGGGGGGGALELQGQCFLREKPQVGRRWWRRGGVAGEEVVGGWWATVSTHRHWHPIHGVTSPPP